jgi:hypothetical protein
MIVIRNQQIQHGIPFEEYLAMERISYSGIKSNGCTFEATPKMRLGTAVHQFLLEPELYDYSQHDIVLPIAMALKEVAGAVMPYCKPEVVVTADMIYNGMMLPYKGRIDLKAPGLILDIKVSEMDLDKSVDHFGYDKQVGGYMIASSTTRGIILSYNRKRRIVQRRVIHLTPEIEDFWAKKVWEKGVAGVTC